MSVVELLRTDHFDPSDIAVLTISSLPTRSHTPSRLELQKENVVYHLLSLLRNNPNLCASLLQSALRSNNVFPQYLGANGTTSTASSIATFGKMPLVRGGDQMKEYAESQKSKGFSKEGEGWVKFLEHLDNHPEIDLRIDGLIHKAVLQEIQQRKRNVVLETKIWNLLIEMSRQQFFLPKSFPLRPHDVVAQNPFHIVTDITHQEANIRLDRRTGGKIPNVEKYRFNRWLADFLRFLHIYGILFTRESLLANAHAVIRTEASLDVQTEEFWKLMQATYGTALLQPLRR